MSEGPKADEWRVGADTERKLELFAKVSNPMRVAARRGIRRRLHTNPNEHDVEEVVVQAFNELWQKDLSSVESPVAMGWTIASRRGFDRGDRVA